MIKNISIWSILWPVGTFHYYILEYGTFLPDPNNNAINGIFVQTLIKRKHLMIAAKTFDTLASKTCGCVIYNLPPFCTFMHIYSTIHFYQMNRKCFEVTECINYKKKRIKRMANYIDTDIELLNLWTALVSFNQPGRFSIDTKYQRLSIEEKIKTRFGCHGPPSNHTAMPQATTQNTLVLCQALHRQVAHNFFRKCNKSS